MKVINTANESRGICKSQHEIAVGTVFTARVGPGNYPDSVYFLRTYTEVVDLEHPELTWSTAANCVFSNYRELSAELYVNYKKP